MISKEQNREFLKRAEALKKKWSRVDRRTKRERHDDITSIKKTASLLLKGLLRDHNRLILNMYHPGLKAMSSLLPHNMEKPLPIDFPELANVLRKVIERCENVLSSSIEPDFDDRPRKYLPSHKNKQTVFRNFLIDGLLHECMDISCSQTEYFRTIASIVGNMSEIETSFDDVKSRAKGIMDRLNRRIEELKAETKRWKHQAKIAKDHAFRSKNSPRRDKSRK